MRQFSNVLLAINNAHIVPTWPWTAVQAYVG